MTSAPITRAGFDDVLQILNGIMKKGTEGILRQREFTAIASDRRE